VEDTAVAPERLRDYIDRFLGIIARHGTTAGVYAHASVGCLHVRPVVNLKTDAGIRTFEAIAAEISDLVARGWADLSPDRFRLTANGLRFADTAAEMFLR